MLRKRLVYWTIRSLFTLFWAAVAVGGAAVLLVLAYLLLIQRDRDITMLLLATAFVLSPLWGAWLVGKLLKWYEWSKTS